jgi:hypothetical protein
MRVLIGCEESQTVLHEILEAGHDGYSCDLQACSGAYPERHYEEDIFEVLATKGPWDLFICHPPCTFMSNSGVKHLWAESSDVIPLKGPPRWEALFKAADFWVDLWNAALKAGIKKIAFENPIPHKYAIRLIGSTYHQLIQPHGFGHAESKATCFWLHGLQPLIETTDLKYEWSQLPKSESQKIFYASPGKDRAKLRSKTFPGIAKAMAHFWANDVQVGLFHAE